MENLPFFMPNAFNSSVVEIYLVFAIRLGISVSRCYFDGKSAAGDHAYMQRVMRRQSTTLNDVVIWVSLPIRVLSITIDRSRIGMFS